MTLTAFGVTWPSVTDDLSRSLAELGYVTLCFGGGYMLSSLVSGRLAEHHSIRRLLLSAALAAVAALAALALSPSWPVFLFAAALAGMSGGLTDAATNTYVAIRRGARDMGIIHSAFGVGAIAGPRLVTILLAIGASWRAAFATLAVAEIVYVVGLGLVAGSIAVPESSKRLRTGGISLRSRALAWSVTVFFWYAGIAAGAGVWAFTLLTEERRISETVGGVAVAAYWGGFTVSRFLLGIVGDRARPDSILRWSVIATAAGFAVFWWNPTPGNRGSAAGASRGAGAVHHLC